MSQALAIEINDLCKRYGTTQAVNHLNLEVLPGEVFGLLGPNGAGKTTTVECVEGLRRPDSGSVMVLGQSMLTEAKRLRPRFGIQLQATGLFPKLTVLETLELYRSFYPKTLDCRQLIAMVGLEGKEKGQVDKLSGGQKQRLTLALALINDPELVFLDEPTSALDPQARRGVWDLIRELKGQGKTVLLTTHYMEEAELLCDRVAIVDAGRVIEQGAPAELIRRHFTETAIEIASQAIAMEQAAGFTGVVRTLVNGDQITLFTLDVHATLIELMDTIPQIGHSLNGITIRQATLEDLFLQLTGRRIRN